MVFESEMGITYSLSGCCDGLSVCFSTQVLEKGLEISTWALSAQRSFIPSYMELSFSVPQKDMQVKWFPLNHLSQCHHYLPYWGDGGEVPYGLAYNAPILCCMNLQGKNRFAFAFSEAMQSGKYFAGAHEDGSFIVKFELFRDHSDKVKHISFSVYIDCRPLQYFQTMSSIAKWYAEKPEYLPLPRQSSAEEPLYSTWYQFQKRVSASELMNELPLIAGLGMKTIIIDDGWQCATNDGGGSNMTTCGEWKPFHGKFPNMRKMVESFHERNILVLLWVAIPFVGYHAEEAYRRFRGKFLKNGECSVLDPRYPEVREYLVNRCEALLVEYHLDGLKLDFIDSFKIDGHDPAAETDYAGCDTCNLSDAIDKLLSAIVCRLKTIKDDVLIEFRQHYTGPAMRKYGNIFRASDCAFDAVQNRVRVTDLRILSDETTVHSDMITWSQHDTAETAALQLLNIIFSVPQISVKLQDLSDDHKRMLMFWLAFWKEHKDTLLHGDFIPEHPELSYPIIRSSKVNEEIIGIYQPNLVVVITTINNSFLINATHTTALVIELLSDMIVHIFDVYGDKVSSLRLSCGISKIPVPLSGYAYIEQIK